MGRTEDSLRERLGIPPGTRRVLIFGETSHWDPNWLLTSEEYYRLRIQSLLDKAIAALEAEPRRVYAIECMFFLDMYWRGRPAARDRIRALVDQGRLRLLGTGLTTPDTLLPDTEAILRDYLLGQQWLRERGMEVEPRLAYLPDDFGHSPELPAVLAALGVTQAGITRIDGMHFVGADYRLASRFPLPGSSAALLTDEHRSADFVWQAADGAEVLTHWNPFTYFQGDMLAHKGIIRWMGLTFGLPWRTAGHVARRIDDFVVQLSPLARTPYLFCPIGCDFNDPIPGLVGLLDRYNRERFGDTGTWVVNAGLDDYLDLVDFHRADLPHLRLDPNPYWMGFYATRPAIKQTCNRTTHKLLAAESRHCQPGGPAGGECRELAEAWELISVANHHDFITGTSPDRVYEAEQRPWLERAERLADAALEQVRPQCDPPASAPVPRWELAGGRLSIDAGAYRAVLTEEAGGCLVSLRDPDGLELLRGPANDVVSYRDSGGLWRLGHEYLGGTFKARARTSQRHAHIRVADSATGLHVTVEAKLEFEPLTRELWFEAESPVIRMRLTGRAARRRTVSVRFPSRLEPARLVMDVVGGLAQRPHSKLYDPTFWPARSFAHLAAAERGLAVIMAGPAAVAWDARGALECIAMRNAPREMAFGLLPVLAHPAAGTDDESQAFDYALALTGPGDPAAVGLPALARRVLADLAGWGGLTCQPPVALDKDDVLITAVKSAHRGDGLIVRLTRYGHSDQVRLTSLGPPIARAALCDARERDLRELEVVDSQVQVPLTTNLTSVRVFIP